MNKETLESKLNLFLSDVKVQLKSVQNDIRLIPETVEQIAANSQVLLGQARMGIESMTDKLVDGDLFKKDYKLQIQHVVTELQTSVVKMLDSIKNAIEKAK